MPNRTPGLPGGPAPDPFDPDVLGRYLAGEASPDESEAVRRALAVDPARARALARALAELEGGVRRQSPPDAAAGWAAVRARLHSPAGGPAVVPPGAASSGDIAPGGVARGPSASRSAAVLPSAPAEQVAPRRRGHAAPAWWRRPNRFAAAAGICLTVAAAAAAWRARHPHRVLAADGARGAGAAAAGRVYVTAPGQRADVLLRDGTRARLAPTSRLRVAADYGAGRRDVYLEGEAYFDVVHDARRPFTVFAAHATARDLGTRFSVRSYADEGAVQVVVQEGAVALSGVGALAAGDVGRSPARGRGSVRRGVDADSALSWLGGRLAFTDAPLAAVLRDVARWYDVDVAADPSLADLPFTGTLAGGSADEAVELVAATLGLRVQVGGARRVLLPVPGRTPRRGAPPAAP